MNEDNPIDATIYAPTSEIIYQTFEVPSSPKLPATCSELTITIKDSEKTQRTKHLVYDNFYLNPDDPVIKQLISQALQEFNAEPESVRIRANLEVL